MIKELIKNNITIINNSFINKENVLKELSNNPFSKYLVYLEKTQVIGYLYYSDIYDRVEINQIEINSIHRNCGYGSKLLEYLINSVNKNITLEVNKENKYAIKLYKKYKFREVAIRKGYYNGIDGILMERLFK